jgi:hypothetical protein
MRLRPIEQRTTDYGDFISHDSKPEARDNGAKHRFKLIRFDDVTLSTAPNYLIKDIIPAGAFVILWAHPSPASRSLGLTRPCMSP